MSGEEKEKVLDLLCDKYVYGLSEEEAKELERLGYDPKDAESIEKTIAALGLIDLEAEAAMPASLQTKLMRDADEFFGSTVADEEAVPQRQIVLDGGSGRSWFGWLGWAAAAAASVMLAVTLFIPRGGPDVARVPTPTPTPEQLTPAQQRQKLMESAGQLVRAEWVPGKMPNVPVSGDVVWSPEKQTGYMRLRGLPKNDASKESYQLWIVDESQDKPIDGGVFDVSADGEVVIPIDAKLKAMNPKLFAITVEKPGGVVVSTMAKFAAQAPVKPNQT
jgi:anti-sigma-K factor RskA